MGVFEPKKIKKSPIIRKKFDTVTYQTSKQRGRDDRI